MSKRRTAGRKRGKKSKHTTLPPWFGIVRLIAAIVLLLLATLTIIPAPTYYAWMLSIVVIEGGIWIAIAGLVLLLIPGWWRSLFGRIAASAALIAISLATVPLVQVLRSRDEVQAALSAFPPEDSARTPFDLRTMVTGVRRPPLEPQAFDYVVRDGRPLRMDLYHVVYNDEPLPVVLVIHGGAWRTGNREQLSRLNTHLAAKRYAVAAIDYRLAPQHPHPAALEDVRAAIEFLKQNAQRLGIDPNRIVLLGRSAGGHLALLTAYTIRDPSIRGVISFYAPTDLRWNWEHPADPDVVDSRAVVGDFMGGSLDELGDAYDRASPISHASRAPATLLIHGGFDPMVPARNAERLMTALGVAERRAAYLRLPWATHGCDAIFRGPCGQISTWAIEAFLDNTMPD